jgi:N-acyl-D-aspartate/D-glutamate deacylase
MHDIVIRGGTILDGTGGEAFTGDIAIDGGRLTAVGGKAGAAKREIEANGLLVTPGWVDVHTHYDGQATWDPVLAPSSWHGVTTILFGNCGVGFAPVRKEHREGLIDLMEAIEDIPGTALAEGLKWDWESFPEYLDALDRMPRTIDIAAQIPHHPLRVFVMGERGINREAATAQDIAEMRRLTECRFGRARSASRPRVPILTRPMTVSSSPAISPRSRSFTASVRQWPRSAAAPSA